MTDFINRLIADDEPEAREIELDGETGTVWFRRLSAGQREQLLRGLKVSHRPGTNDGSIEIDLGENEHQGQLLVLFSVCDETGKAVFKNIQAVQKIPHRKFKVLLREAEAVNKGMGDDTEDDLGKG